MPRKSVQPRGTVVQIESFDFDNRTYQIDPKKMKVYRGFVEIETSKAAQIFSVWRSQKVGV